MSRRSLDIAIVLQLALAASAIDIRSVRELQAVPSFAVVVSSPTAQRFFGAGLPQEYKTHVPPIPGLVSTYLEQAQTLAFVDADQAIGSLASHKLVVLPETTGLAEHDGQAILDFAKMGGAVILSGGSLLYGVDNAALGQFSTPLGAALGLEHRGVAAADAVVASTNVSKTANPEWWRLLTPPADGHFLRPDSPANSIQNVAPTSDHALVLATVTLSDGATIPLVTAMRVGERGWLVYCASSEPQLLRQAVNFVFAATGVYLNPGAGSVLSGHSPMALAPAPPATNVMAASNTAVLAFAAPAEPLVSLEGRYRVTLLGAANSTTCVQLLDNWWGDSGPSHTITGVSHAQDVTVVAQVSCECNHPPCSRQVILFFRAVTRVWLSCK